MKPIEIAALLLAFSVGINGTACRKPKNDAPPPASSDAPAATIPTETGPSAQSPTKSPVPALSAKDEMEIRKRYMATETAWAKKTPDQKRMAYFSWCQIYMLGDTAVKAKVLDEIRRAGLPPEDLNALKQTNRDLRIPLLPL